MKKVFFLLSIILTSSCSVTNSTIDLFPVEGPLSSQIPVSVITATAENVTSYGGKLFLTMPDGEKCNGRWSSSGGVTGSQNNYSLLITYGEKLNLSPRGNEERGYAMLLGDRGTTIDIEFLTGVGTGHGFGVAKDNKGNVYKVIF